MTAYMTLYLSIRDAITSGVYGYGAKLPSKRQTAEAQGVSLITVAHAYDLLVEEGYVEPRERSGYFVVFREMDNYGAADPRPMSRSMDIARAKTEQREAGERDLFPFSIFARTMRSVLSAYGEKILDPSPNHGCEELRRAIASNLC